MTSPVQVKGAARGVTRGRASTIVLEWLGDPSTNVRKEWVIPGMLGIGEVMVIHADTKVGKTQLATQISFAVAILCSDLMVLTPVSSPRKCTGRALQ